MTLDFKSSSAVSKLYVERVKKQNNLPAENYKEHVDRTRKT